MAERENFFHTVDTVHVAATEAELRPAASCAIGRLFRGAVMTLEVCDRSPFGLREVYAAG